jgi:hypothetical protein
MSTTGAPSGHRFSTRLFGFQKDLLKENSPQHHSMKILDDTGSEVRYTKFDGLRSLEPVFSRSL